MEMKMQISLDLDAGRWRPDK